MWWAWRCNFRESCASEPVIEERHRGLRVQGLGLRNHLGLGRRIVLLELLLPTGLVERLLVVVLLLGAEVALVLILILGGGDAARDVLRLKTGQEKASAMHREPTFRIMGL